MAAIEPVVEFAQVAAVLEATGVDAYAGAAPEIGNAAFVPPTMSVHGAEANHATYLRTHARATGVEPSRSPAACPPGIALRDDGTPGPSID